MKRRRKISTKEMEGNWHVFHKVQWSMRKTDRNLIEAGLKAMVLAKSKRTLQKTNKTAEMQETRDNCRRQGRLGFNWYRISPNNETKASGQNTRKILKDTNNKFILGPLSITPKHCSSFTLEKGRRIKIKLAVETWNTQTSSVTQGWGAWCGAAVSLWSWPESTSPICLCRVEFAKSLTQFLWS